MPFDSAPTVIAESAELQLLRRARSYIDTPAKWCQYLCHSTRTGTDRYCILGAIRMADGAYKRSYRGLMIQDGRYRPTQASESLLGALLRASGRSGSIWDFNDAVGTTHADVMVLFDKVEDHLLARDRDAVR